MGPITLMFPFINRMRYYRCATNEKCIATGCIFTLDREIKQSSNGQKYCGPKLYQWDYLFCGPRQKGENRHTMYDTSSSSSLFLFPSHIQQLTSTDKSYILLQKVNGDVDAIKERKACN